MMLIKMIKKQYKFECLDKFWNKHQRLSLLDVGCGNHSPSNTCAYYPLFDYYGVDRSKEYNLNERDFSCMKVFYEEDLESSDLEVIPDNFFDCVILAHVIEHLNKGEEVLQKLLYKLKIGGIIYLEFPAPRSRFFPPMKPPIFGSTLNFYDDPTHIRIYEIKDLENILIANDYVILSSGVRRSWKRIILFPLYLIYSILVLRHINGGLFWDLLGFADYIVAKRKG